MRKKTLLVELVENEGIGKRRSCRGWFLILSLILAVPGCFSYLHPVHPLPLEVSEPCQDLPKCCRDHVYIFLVNGFDPMNYGNLTGIRDYLHNLGFHKTYYGQLFHGPHFDKEIRRIQNEDPDARFVLAGFSLGGGTIKAITDSLLEDGIEIDLLVYLDGVTFVQDLHDRPENVGRIINISAPYLFYSVGIVDDAENVDLPDGWHFGVPTHDVTLEVLARELFALAETAPVIVESEQNPAPENAPTPRKVVPKASREPTEWDFLKPVSRLRMPEMKKEANPAHPKAEKIAQQKRDQQTGIKGQQAGNSKKASAVGAHLTGLDLSADP